MEQLTKRIQELVPELLELSFGCEVSLKNYYDEDNTQDDDKIYIICNTVSETECELYHKNTHKVEVFSTPYLKDVCEILGHPIQLHHVLRAIDEEGQTENKRLPGFVFGGYTYSWDLTKDLSGQSQETVDFLNEILK